ncbi:hypothetical protein CCP2SC5_1020014 [Azospirillaceae bacterium]
MDRNDKIVSVDFSGITDKDLVGYLRINLAVLRMKIGRINKYLDMSPDRRKSFRESGELMALYEEIMEESHFGVNHSRR